MDFVNDSDHFDQHFLKDEKIIDAFLASANLKDTDVVVEIGPGKGQISEKIARKVNKLYCIELDERLRPWLDDLAFTNPNVEIRYGNVLDQRIPECNKIITALPYSIVEPFINKLIKCKFDEAIMITGEKFADNVTTNQVTMLSLLTNSFFEVKKIMSISPEVFDPAPRVMSAIIKLKPLKKEDITSFVKLVFRQMFFFRDMKIKNAIMESLIIAHEILYKMNLTKRQSKELVTKLELSDELLNKTFETCSNDELKIIYDRIKSLKKN